MDTIITTISTRAPALDPCCGDMPRLCVSMPGDRRREAVEQYISGVFQASYDARILQFLPLLLTLEDKGMPRAALGLRSAGSGPLFAEQYLSMPVERQVAESWGRLAPRSRIMELGNLVSSSPGQSVLLYLLVTAALYEAGVQYLLFAANRAVRRSIRRTGFTPRQVCAALPECLPDGGVSWGRYYQGDPQVMLGDMALTHRQALAQPAIAALLNDYALTIQELADTLREQRW